MPPAPLMARPQDGGDAGPASSCAAPPASNGILRSKTLGRPKNAGAVAGRRSAAGSSAQTSAHGAHSSGHTSAHTSSHGKPQLGGVAQAALASAFGHGGGGGGGDRAHARRSTFTGAPAAPPASRLGHASSSAVDDGPSSPAGARAGAERALTVSEAGQPAGVLPTLKDLQDHLAQSTVRRAGRMNFLESDSGQSIGANKRGSVSGTGSTAAPGTQRASEAGTTHDRDGAGKLTLARLRTMSRQRLDLDQAPQRRATSMLGDVREDTPAAAAAAGAGAGPRKLGTVPSARTKSSGGDSKPPPAPERRTPTKPPQNTPPPEPALTDFEVPLGHGDATAAYGTKGGYFVLRSKHRVYLADLRGITVLWRKAAQESGAGHILRSDVAKVANAQGPDRLGFRSGDVLRELLRRLADRATSNLVTLAEIIGAAYPYARADEVTQLAREAQTVATDGRVPRGFDAEDWKAVRALFFLINKNASGLLPLKRVEALVCAIAPDTAENSAVGTLVRQQLRTVDQRHLGSGAFDLEAWADWFVSVNRISERPLSTEEVHALTKPGSQELRGLLAKMEDSGGATPPVPTVQQRRKASSAIFMDDSLTRAMRDSQHTRLA